eukprot:CAMPEP_0113866736 /NCGR_PEP_ID=MMETSP0780_2-20120614/32_1 /TAXON_ID=652834 /ORGANISM="Palpitomonas bilix" /LENGTH=70 /DNA_ID=CAMNT_0000851607 /DNA_START=130 /DNA_END=342 /DNA_ORIENTATION=+ /assembly_acc=CAM_ASM_000599
MDTFNEEVDNLLEAATTSVHSSDQSSVASVTSASIDWKVGVTEAVESSATSDLSDFGDFEMFALSGHVNK